MNRKDAIETENMLRRLEQIGIARCDAEQLRRIAMTLHRWHELECGDGNGHAAWCIVRGHKAGTEFTYDDDGDAYIERHNHSGPRASYYKVPNRERGAQKRLAKILAKYPTLKVYIQGDPRGAPLYILPPEVTAENYNRGVAVYK